MQIRNIRILKPSTPIRYSIFCDYLRIWGIFLRIYFQKIMAALYVYWIEMGDSLSLFPPVHISS